MRAATAKQAGPRNPCSLCHVAVGGCGGDSRELASRNARARAPHTHLAAAGGPPEARRLPRARGAMRPWTAAQAASENVSKKQLITFLQENADAAFLKANNLQVEQPAGIVKRLTKDALVASYCRLFSKDASSPELSDLSAELIVEIAIHAPLAPLRQTIRFNVREVACMRLQRWFREPKSPTANGLSVGDRVIVRRGHGLSACFATVAAVPGQSMSCKLRLLDGRYMDVPRSRVKGLEPWADGPWGEAVGRTAALVSASAARGAALDAATAAMAVARAADGSRSVTALAVAAASAASTAAAAATAAAGVAAMSDATQALQATQLLRVAARIKEAAVTVGPLPVAVTVGPLPPAVTAGPLQAAVAVGLAGTADDELSSAAFNLAQAATSAAAAAEEAKAAASAASAIQAVGELAATAGMADVAAAAAGNVVSVVEALAETEEALASPAAQVAAAEVAAGVLAEVGVAGRAFTAAWANSGDASTLSGHTPLKALAVAQEAADELRCAALRASSAAELVPSLSKVQPQRKSKLPSPPAEKTSPPVVPVPSRDEVLAWLQRVNPPKYGNHVAPSAQQSLALEDAADGITSFLTALPFLPPLLPLPTSLALPTSPPLAPPRGRYHLVTGCQVRFAFDATRKRVSTALRPGGSKEYVGPRRALLEPRTHRRLAARRYTCNGRAVLAGGARDRITW